MTANPALRKTNTIPVAELAAALAASRDVVLLDVRFAPGRTGLKESYIAGHLPGAIYIDLATELADAGGPDKGRGSNPLPNPAKLEADLRRKGVGRDSTVVVYDDGNGAPAARAWWTLTWAGLPDVRILDGGIAAWKAAGHALESGEVEPRRPGDVVIDAGKLPSLDAVAAASFAGKGILVDVRPAATFGGQGTGHIPGARNFPANRLLGPDGRLASAPELAQRLREAAIDTTRPLAAYCGGGVAAALFTLALAEIGTEVALYPGSWSEWTADRTRPIEL